MLFGWVFKQQKLHIHFFLACLEGVEHQHTDGHGTYSPRDRCDGRAQRGDRLEVHITLKSETRLARGVGHTCSTNVDDHSSGLDHIGCDKSRLPHCSNENICLTALLLEVERM